MCEICGRIKCHPRCPNHERHVYGYCAYCKNPIYTGEGEPVTAEHELIFCDEQCFKDYYDFNFIDWSDVDAR